MFMHTYTHRCTSVYKQFYLPESETSWTELIHVADILTLEAGTFYSEVCKVSEEISKQTTRTDSDNKHVFNLENSPNVSECNLRDLLYSM